MRWLGAALVAILVTAAGSPPASADNPPSATDILNRVLDSDPWGLNGATITARATLTDKGGSKSELSLVAKSKRYDPPLSKSIVRFSAPPDLAGAGFLQIQKRDGDDDRYLFLPELKRSRRIAGSLRSNAFMGTDFSFADLDRRDLRDADARLTGDEPVASWPCYVVDVTPRREDAQYSHTVMWVRKDNFLTLKTKMFDKGGVLEKTFEALEVKRVAGHWFISKSRMHDVQHAHTTELVLEDIVVKADIDDDEFTMRALEKP
ncbi:MAG TPA: outer membrane lipoprotein-sorting protein [Polyangiaceae bacterium]|jgi:outer membrane lipoprotein-sorting protein